MGSSPKGSDRRTATRQSIRVPIEAAALGQGMTVDISATGVAFEIDRVMVPAGPLELQFALSGSDILLRCEGRVVRTEERGERMLLAVTIDHMQVLPIPPDVCQHDDPQQCNHVAEPPPATPQSAADSVRSH
jgi:hypothetical protein